MTKPLRNTPVPVRTALAHEGTPAATERESGWRARLPRPAKSLDSLRPQASETARTRPDESQQTVEASFDELTRRWSPEASDERASLMRKFEGVDELDATHIWQEATAEETGIQPTSSTLVPPGGWRPEPMPWQRDATAEEPLKGTLERDQRDATVLFEYEEFSRVDQKPSRSSAGVHVAAVGVGPSAGRPDLSGFDLPPELSTLRRFVELRFRAQRAIREYLERMRAIGNTRAGRVRLAVLVGAAVLTGAGLAFVAQRSVAKNELAAQVTQPNALGPGAANAMPRGGFGTLGTLRGRMPSINSEALRAAVIRDALGFNRGRVRLGLAEPAAPKVDPEIAAADWPAAERRAVDAVIGGRISEAIEHYRRLIRSGAPSAQFESTIAVLEQKLRTQASSAATGK